jgi:hypothetical protein
MGCDGSKHISSPPLSSKKNLKYEDEFMNRVKTQNLRAKTQNEQFITSVENNRLKNMDKAALKQNNINRIWLYSHSPEEIDAAFVIDTCRAHAMPYAPTHIPV